MDAAVLTARPVTEAQVRALAARARAEGDHRLVVLAGAPVWTGEPVLDTDTWPIRVVACPSPLAARAAVAEHPRDGEGLLVLVTDRHEQELGEELLAAAWRGRVIRVTAWEACKALFKVDQVHPALRDDGWLVDLLVDVAPPRGYPPPTGGILDPDTAWRTALRHALGVESQRATLGDLVRWAHRQSSVDAVQGLTAQQRVRITERLAATAGPTAPHLVRLVAEGRGADAVPLGLVCAVLWADGIEGHDAVAARARFEGPLGTREFGYRSAREWAEAATDAYRDAQRGGEDVAVVAWADRVQQLLHDVGGDDLVAASDVLPRAFGRRLEIAGWRLGAVVDDPDETKLRLLADAVRSVDEHVLAGLRTDRTSRLRMALRLARRRVAGAPASPPASLPGAADAYLHDGAFVDEARAALAGGETVPPLADAYGRLSQVVDEERHGRDRAFARQLAAWSAHEPLDVHPLLPIEAVLREVVAPLVAQAPTVVLVVDGLAHDVSHRLLSDIAALGWLAVEPLSGLPHVVAAIPTVTQVSRTSLLTGRLMTGGADVERDGFVAVPALRASGHGPAPVLFHKRDLGVDAGRIAPPVREALQDRSRRLVGVVVNAVDDHLAKGGQLRLADGLEGVPPLRWLLNAAVEARRVVVITSDHGHVHEHGTRVRPGGAGTGERWRPAVVPPVDDREVEIAGPRVLAGGGRVVAAADDTLRYVAEKKHGYHGGATPAEVLCALAVFVPAGVDLDGYVQTALARPSWWDDEPTVSERPRVGADEVLVPVDAAGRPQLFPPDEPVASTAAPWIERLLSSPVLEQQRQLAGRAPLDDQDLAALLRLLEVNGDVATRPALARATELPPGRLRTKVEALKRLLNVDAYEVVAVDADGTVRLNRELLVVQFGLDRAP